MSKEESALSKLELRGPRPIDGVFDLYEAVYDASPNPQEHVYSCVAVYRQGWKGMDWPALGGTRWINARVKKGEERSQEDTRHEAVELAMSMHIKNSILRKADAALQPDKKDGHLFNWQGGKGVIWTPPEADLTPLRLMCHGRLIEFLHGEYIGSKDQGVGTTGLKWISCATRYTIGLGCLRDTGEATANGVHAGLEATVRRQAESFGADSLRGIPILVMGIGKVGYPLVELLHASGAEVYVFDGALRPDEQAVGAWCEAREDKDAPEERRAAQRSAMAEILRGRRILSSEAEALALPQIRIVSPNGGNTEWLAEPLNGFGTRARILAENRRRNHNLRLILGAGNDQVSTTDKGKEGREEVLSILKEADIAFVPDPLVSPGGVIAVSHELAPKWEAEAVNKDTRRIVEQSIDQVFRQAERLGGTDAVTMYRAFEAMVHQDWI